MRYSRRSGRRLAAELKRAGEPDPGTGFVQRLDSLIGSGLVSETTGLRRAFRHRRFALLWVGQTVSAFGDSLHRLALVWWVMQKTGSGLAMGTVMVCTLVPMVPCLLIGGALVERVGAVRLMLVSDVARFILTALLAYLMAVDQLTNGHVYVFATLFGFVASFFSPAAAALLPTLVTKDDLPSANSLTAISRQVGTIAGPMAAAAIISLGKSELAFAIDAVTYVISAVSLLPLLRRAARVAGAGEQPPSVVADVLDGIAYVKREPWLWISILAFFLINPAAAPIVAVVVPYVIIQDNHQGAAVLGLVQASLALGTVAAAVWLGRRPRLARRGVVVYKCVIAVGLASIGFGFPIPTFAMAALAAFVGFCNSMLFLAWLSLLQDLVPAEKLGRVYSIDMMTAIVPIPIGMAVVGWGIDRMEAWAICLIAGGIVIVSAMLALLHPQIRSID